MFKSKLLFLIIINLIFFNSSYGQSSIERQKIVTTYDIDKLTELSERLTEEYETEKRRVIAYALKNNIEIIKQQVDGGISILYKIREDGTPLYKTTFNAGSAVTISTNEVYDGGSNGLSLSGNNINFGIWDGGGVRATHQELTGRVIQMDDPAGLNGHATHVSGTMIASGILPDVKGMSFEGTLSAYDFDNDIPEMIQEAANGMLVSNHSYGLNPNSIPDSEFGAYVIEAYNVDNLTYNAQYYLPVYAAGNSQGALPPYNPNGNGYDLISGANLAKNILSVANVEQVNNYVDPSSVNIWNNSSWGPADDGRIKPDISAKGRLTKSSNSAADDGYDFRTGTSMAAPAVSGSIGLLHEHYNNLYGGYLTAASMKALVLHTAREAGNDPGPDYIYGWGLMNTSAAAEIITNNNFTNIIEENTLNEGDTYTFTVNAVDPNTPLIATMAWTDPAGPIQSTATADDPTPRLVNDLDIKIIAPDGFTEFLPWTLSAANPSAAAVKGDNTVDNVEKVEIENAVGQYTIEVSHKGNLQDLLQNYTLIVSGIAESDFALTTDNGHKSVCGNETAATFDLNINSIESFTGTITLSQSGLPIDLNASFGSTVITNEGQTTLSIDNLSAVPHGDYPFTVTATSGTSSYSFDFVLNIREVINLNSVTLISPVSNTEPVYEYLTPVLEWDPLLEALSYEVQVSTSPSFNDIAFSAITENTQIESSELNADMTYHWRVRPLNDCVVGDFSSSFFNTPVSACYPLVFSTDTPLGISSSGTSIVQSVIPVNTILEGGNLIDVNVHLELSHTRLSDLIISLTSPEGTEIMLLNQACGNLDDIDVIFDDKGNTPNCDGNNTVALSGTIKPEENLSLFENEQVLGDWILTVEDTVPNEGGSLESFGLDICNEAILSVNDTDLPQFIIYPNPTSGPVELNFNQQAIENLEVQIIDLNGRILKTFNFENSADHFNLDLSDLSSGIYFISLRNENHSSVEKLIIK